VLNGALIDSRLIDELVVYFAPSLIGSDGRGMFDLAGVVTMSDKVECSFIDCTRVGPDMRLRLLLAGKPESDVYGHHTGHG
jgi:diaminohydroxyphosphoribosylaminopyrimidine deaminase/5-amino-6-(5-phosphoribosylamino)uracil reductase